MIPSCEQLFSCPGQMLAQAWALGRGPRAGRGVRGEMKCTDQVLHCNCSIIYIIGQSVRTFSRLSQQIIHQ